MPTSHFETIVREKAENEGWKVLRRGWPDFLLVKGSRLLFLEVKSENDGLSKDQREMLSTLYWHGLTTWTEQAPLDLDTFDRTHTLIEQNRHRNLSSSYEGLGVS